MKRRLNLINDDYMSYSKGKENNIQKFSSSPSFQDNIFLRFSEITNTILNHDKNLFHLFFNQTKIEDCVIA